MNDRYLFRAKRKNWKQLPKEMWWVEGYLYGIWEHRYILWGMINDVPNMVEVDTLTICQCTGLKDKNGKLVWENDVIIVNGRYKGRVIWSEIWTNYMVIRNRNGNIDINISIHNRWNDVYEVIGNIFDNPELMHE